MSTTLTVDYGGTRSELHTFLRSIRSGLSAFSAAYKREHVLSHAEIINNLTALRDASGSEYLLADETWDRRGRSFASHSRSYAERKLRREWTRFERELKECEESGWSGWSVQDREVVQSAWSAKPKSLIELARGMASAVQSQSSVPSFVSTLPVTSDTTKTAMTTATTTPSGATTTTIKQVSTENQGSDKEVKSCCPASTK